MPSSGFVARSCRLNLDPGRFSFRQGSRFRGCYRRQSYVADERRCQYDGQSNDEQYYGEGGEPVRQAKRLGQRLHRLIGHQGSTDVDQQHLPQGAAVDLNDQPLETIHTANCGLGYVQFGDPVLLKDAVLAGG